ncbi:hypothetical protein HJC23_008541 [Cyclotella cryptica]|uniref:Uncharacterized protein n=1 Tax=Cyclotella cryptica TaxID=29204 RepID=A0ABD3QYU3_9STRA
MLIASLPTTPIWCLACPTWEGKDFHGHKKSTCNNLTSRNSVCHIPTQTSHQPGSLKPPEMPVTKTNTIIDYNKVCSLSLAGGHYYLGMFKRSPYPLASLKYLGTLCPCLEKEEDGPARQAAWALASTPIRWHRKLRSESSPKADAAHSVSGFLSGMFRTTSGNTADRAHYGALEGSTLSVVDSIKGPSLMIHPPSNDVKSKCIPLKFIKTIQIPSGVIDSLVGSRSAIQILDKRGRELLRFDLLKPTTASVPDSEWQDTEGDGSASIREDADEKTREEFIDQLEILVEWERRRQDYLITMGDDDEKTDDMDIAEYDDGPTSIKP